MLWNPVTKVSSSIRFFLAVIALWSGCARADLAGVYHSANDVPVTAATFSAGGATIDLMLNFAPSTGATLTVINNTGPDLIAGTFANLAHGQVVSLSYGGINYRFIANYYGGNGNDLVLQWAPTRLLAWGKNSWGQVGDGSSNVYRRLPVDVLVSGVLAGKSVISIAAGKGHSLALCSDGTVAAWGVNTSGQLGDNSTTNRSVPVLVTATGALAGKTVVSIAVGSNFSLALCSDGTVAAWGDNSYGQLGNNSTTHSSVPVAINTQGVLNGRKVTKLAASEYYSLALFSDGTLAAWGVNDSGQLGNNSTTPSRVPVLVDTTGALSGKKVSNLAVGFNSSLVLCSDGALAAWGGDVLVPTTVQASGALAGKTVIGVASGYFHRLALCSDGTVAAWGSNDSGQLGDGTTTTSSIPIAVSTSGALAGKAVVGIAAGEEHSLALCSDGTLTAWGDNFDGQLGNNGSVDSPLPVIVSSSKLGTGERFAGVFSGFAAGHNFAFVSAPPFPKVTSAGAIDITKTSATLTATLDPNGSPTSAQFEYGLDLNFGSVASVSLTPSDGLGPQLVSTTLNGLTPGLTYYYQFRATNTLTSITQGGSFTASIDIVANYQVPSYVPYTAGNVFAAGGMFSATLNFAPTPGANLMVVNNTGVNPIGGTFENLAQGQQVSLTFGGINYLFQANYFGGNGNDLVLEWAKTRSVAWGEGTNGQIGNSNTSSQRIPTNVFSTGVLAGRTVASGATGNSHTLALCSDGTLAAWGAGTSGQLGGSSSVPIAVYASGVLAGKRAIAVSAGYSHSLALLSDGTVAAWGENSSGELGNNSTYQSYLPVKVNTTGVLSGKVVVAVSAGRNHNLVLCSDGTVAAWGYNGYGRLGNGSTTQSSVPVVVNASGVLAGKTVVAVSAGGVHSLALCSDGTVVAWGFNGSGQLGDGTTANSSVPVAVHTGGLLSGKTVVAIAAGGSHSMALCSDGTLASWGMNSSGQLGDNSTTSSSAPVAVFAAGVLAGKTVTSISAGQYHSLVGCSDGTIATWGLGSSGQLGNNSTVQRLVPVAVSSTPLGVGERYLQAITGSSANHNLGLVASPPPPVVTSLEPSNLQSGSVFLNATVNAATGSAAVTFEYGTTPAFGSFVAGSPAMVTGSTHTVVFGQLLGLTHNTNYYYRVKATNAGGMTTGPEQTFTTPPDVTGPQGGTMNLAPASPVNAGAALAVTFASWTDQSTPRTYEVFIDDVLVSPQGITTTRNITGPTIAGSHTLKGRIYDPVGNFTEITQNFTVNTPQETWRALHFGSVQNAGAGADLADPDGDGASNHFEYVAGLVPTDPLSRFQVRVEAVAGQAAQKAITFGPLVAGRLYTVRYKANLSDPEWTALADIVSADNGAERTVTDLSAGTVPRFYQVQISLP